VLPDLDGLGIVVDLGNYALGRPETDWYTVAHHVWLHGLFGTLLIPAILAIGATNRLRCFLIGVVVVHLHLFCDVVGSRGPDMIDVWPIHYLGPFLDHLSIAWAGQWPLNAWQNVVTTLALIGFVFVRAATVGHSPLSLVSVRGNEAFVERVRMRWRQLRGSDV